VLDPATWEIPTCSVSSPSGARSMGGHGDAFNLGIGFCLCRRPDQADAVLAATAGAGSGSWEVVDRVGCPFADPSLTPDGMHDRVWHNVGMFVPSPCRDRKALFAAP
jgi:hypothetical protein